MLFNSVEFVIFFIFVFATVVILKKRKYQHLFLLAASYFFFYFTSNYLLVLLIFSTILDFYVGNEIWKSNNVLRKKFLLIASLVGNFGLLGFFKYSDFVIAQFNVLGTFIDFASEIPLLNLVLPIGISFYTFQTVSYTVDIYRGKLTPAKSFWEFALFVTFFPQLVAGPIVRAKEFLPQLREKIENVGSKLRLRQIVISSSNLKLGISIMAFGFLKKMFFGDNIAPMVNEIFADPIGLESFTIILGSIGFGIQLYGDFSGYSDIAIGAALIFGFKLPLNFNNPFFARSPADFRRRWHITLYTWFKDYLYIPLGGNRKSRVRTYFNLWFVMFMSGFWHGASWNFVIWGLLTGSYLAIHRAISNTFPSFAKHRFFKSKLGIFLSIFVTQYIVFLSMTTFRVRDVEHMLYSMQKYVMLDFATSGTLEFISQHPLPVILIAIFWAIHFIIYKIPDLIERIAKLRISYWFIFLLGLILLILLFYNGDPQDFYYFQF